MEPYDLIPIFIVQVFVVGALAQWWAGVHLIREEQKGEGWLFVIIAVPQFFIWSYMTWKAHGWVALGLAALLPALVSVAVYWLYERKQRSRTFIWIALALEMALLVFIVSLIPASEASTGYWGLAASAIASSLSVYLWRKYRLRTPGSNARQRTNSGFWATVGAMVGIGLGRLLIAVLEEVVPEVRAAVGAFLLGWVAFSILGCAAWEFKWEVKKRR